MKFTLPNGFQFEGETGELKSLIETGLLFTTTPVAAALPRPPVAPAAIGEPPAPSRDPVVPPPVAASVLPPVRLPDGSLNLEREAVVMHCVSEFLRTKKMTLIPDASDPMRIRRVSLRVKRDVGESYSCVILDAMDAPRRQLGHAYVVPSRVIVCFFSPTNIVLLEPGCPVLMAAMQNPGATRGLFFNIDGQVEVSECQGRGQEAGRAKGATDEGRAKRHARLAEKAQRKADRAQRKADELAARVTNG